MSPINHIVRRLLAPLKRRVELMIGRGVLRAVNDQLKMQEVQISLLSDELRDGIERFQTYGFTAHPHPGAEGIYLSLGGLRNHGVVIAIDDRRYRIKSLAEGEVAIYTDEDAGADGHRIVLKRGAKVEVHCTDAVVTAGRLARLDGDVVEIHAKTRLHLDVNGYGEDWVCADGTYRVDTFKIGNTVAGGANAISPPDHPPLVNP